MDQKQIMETRKKRLRRWIDDDFEGRVVAFVRYFELSPSMASYISQLFSGIRQFGEKAARQLEAKTRKPSGWLDWPEGEVRKYEAATDPQLLKYDRAAVAKLPEEERAKISAFIAFTVKTWESREGASKRAGRRK